MRAQVFFGWILPTLGCAIAVDLPARLSAADEIRVAAEFAAADESLNATYQRVMGALSPFSRESLRRAQRAWIVFVDKNAQAVLSFTDPEERLLIRLAETVARQKQLEAMLQPQAQADAAGLRDQMREADRELNAWYGRLLRAHEEGAETVREAQRAWIVYRDENARACRDRETEATLLSTAQRVVQLRSLLLGSFEPAIDEEQKEPRISQRLEKLPPGRKVPNPYNRAH